MKNLKKMLCGILIVIIWNITCYVKVNALFVNTHFNLGKKMVRHLDGILSESEKEAFLSGLVYADIGRFKFDKENNIKSDSYEFAGRMKEFAKTPEEKWFVRGFNIHIIQDNKTRDFLKEVLGQKKYSSYLEYILDCSLIDSYFLKNNEGPYNNFLDKFNFEQVASEVDMESLSELVNIPEDKIENFVRVTLDNYSHYPNKHNLVIYGDLIKDTYKSFGFEVSLDEIYEQAANVVGAFIVTSDVAKKKEISEDLALKIENKSNELARICVYSLMLSKKS